MGFCFLINNLVHDQGKMIILIQLYGLFLLTKGQFGKSDLFEIELF